MNRSGWRSRLAALITALIAFTGLLSLSSLPAWATVGTVTEFPTLTVNSEPFGITSGPDGNVWFTEENSSKIGRITTS
jgi:streptogramin lyase